MPLARLASWLAEAECHCCSLCLDDCYPCFHFNCRHSGHDNIADIERFAHEMAMSQDVDLTKSLQALEDSDWGDPQTAETPMIGRVLALRRRPLTDLSNDEVRLAVSQKVSLPLVLGLAIDRLRANPLLECEHFPGDLLATLMLLADEDWGGRIELRSVLAVFFRDVMERAGDDADAFRDAFELSSNEHRAI